MTALASRRIPNAVFGLSLFWGGILSAFFWTAGFGFKYLLPWFCAILAGAWLAHDRSAAYKKQILSRLKYREDAGLPVSDRSSFLNSDRGVFSTLGPIPFPVKALPRAQGYSFADLQSRCPKELAENDALARILGKFLGPTARSTKGQYIAVFDALSMTMLHPDHVGVPAGIDRHIGRSLLTHSLLVSALMVHRAPAYQYMPLGIDPIDPNFKLDENDPLIPILGMAHDLGKIRTLIYDADGNALGLRRGHDTQSARDMAQIAEFWNDQISIEDRRIIQLALAYSGRVADTPIQKLKGNSLPVVTSDRLHALIGLMAECDRLASNIEMGGSYDFGMAPEVIVPVIQEDAVEPTNILDTIARYLLTGMRVNASGSGRSVAFKYKDEEFTRGRDVLIIDEMEFVRSFAEFVNKSELNARDKKSSSITQQVLERLDEEGYLFRLKEEAESNRAAASCLYKILLSDPTKEPGTGGVHLNSTFLVDVTSWPSMAKLRDIPNCNSKPSFVGFRLGQQGVAPKRRSASDDIRDVSQGAEIRPVGQDLSGFLVERKPKKSSDPAKIIAKIGSAILSKKIQIAMTDDKFMAVLGFDEFFRGLGLTIQEYDTLPENFEPIGIRQINKSTKDPSTHVIRLDKAIYKKFSTDSLVA